MAVINWVCVAGSHDLKELSEGEVVVVRLRLEWVKGQGQGQGVSLNV